MVDDLSNGWLVSGARKVNAAGDVVGAGYFDAYNRSFAVSSAFVYTDVLGFKDVDDLIPQDFTWSMREARSINAAGEIVGWGYHTGMQGPRPYRIKLPSGQSASCQARNMCGGGDGDPVCLFSDGVVETTPATSLPSSATTTRGRRACSLQSTRYAWTAATQ